MRHPKRQWSMVHGQWSIAIVLTLCIVSSSATSNHPTTQPPNHPDETALRAVVEKFFAAYAKKDLDGFIVLWSDKSPDLASRKQVMQQRFATRNSAFANLTISRVKVEGEKANLRVAVDLKTFNPRTQQERLERLMDNFGFVKEDGVWKVWRHASAFDDLAAALIAAKSQEERNALLAAEKELTTSRLGIALADVGNRFYRQGDNARALSIYRLMHGIAEQIGDKAGMAGALMNVGNIYRTQGDLTQALESYQKAFTQFEALGDQVGMAFALNNVGAVHQGRGNSAQGLEFYLKSLKIAEELKHEALIGGALNNIGRIHYEQGNFAQAAQFYQRSLGIQEASGNKVAMATTLINIGDVQHEQGDCARAVEFYQKGLKVAEELKDKVAMSRALNRIGNVHFSQGDYARALEFHQRSGKIGEESKDKAVMAAALNYVGNVYLMQGDYEQALEFYQKSLKMAEELGNQARMAEALSNIGSVHYLRGDHAQAMEFYQRALTMTEELRDERKIAYARTNIGDVHHAQDRHEQALKFYREALAQFEALGDKDGIALTLEDMSGVYLSQGSYAQALECANRCAAIAVQRGNPERLWFVRYRAGKAAAALNQPTQARQAFEESIAIVERMRGQVAGGERQQQRFFEDKVKPYHAMVKLLIEQNQTSDALTYAERAKARVLLDVLRSGKVNVTKAMTTDELEKERKLNNELVSLNTQVAREKDETRRADLQVRLQKTRLDYEAFQTSLYVAHPDLKAQRGETKPITLEETRALLPDAKTALLEFTVMEGKTFLFVLTMRDERLGMRDKSSNQTSSLIPHPSSLILKVYALDIKRDDLAKHVRKFRAEVSDPNRPVDSAGPLYDLLLKPAQEQLQGKTTLVIVPDDALWELPFQALQPKDNHYLLEDSAISYAPSLTVLREMQKVRMGVWEYGSMGDKNTSTPPHSHTPTLTLLAFGNPTLEKETVERVQLVKRDAKLAPLPQAEKEVKSLAQFYGAQRSKVYVGADAREERMKAEAARYRVLHFATHGMLNDASPMYSHLLLAQTPSPPNNGLAETHRPYSPLTTHHSPDDGLLEAWELMKLDLNADLVVLSACETARGRLGAGEGIIGLTWALFVAGCPTTVVSQWKVADDSTRQLMVEFHKKLKLAVSSKQLAVSKAEALRQAALTLRRSGQYRHPFYWAGFVVVGDGR